MREIKFRAWDNIAGMRGSSDFPNLTQFWNYVSNRDLVQGFQVMQYTGLKDKNGIEIYEGDIIKRVLFHGGETVHTIVFAEYRFAYTERKGYVALNKAVAYHQRLEVIGNIYENPELLEATK